MATRGEEPAWASADWAWDSRSLSAKPLFPEAAAAPAESSGAAASSAGGKTPRGAHSSMEAKSSPATAAVAAAAAGGSGCQVEGCLADVGGKEYHARYKICEAHLKAPMVVRGGQEQRFCQQCGKFQPLTDFDADKRSCRERLDKHNARRRRMREMQQMLRKTGKVDEQLLKAKYGLTEKELAPKVARLARAGVGEGGAGRAARRGAKRASPSSSSDDKGTAADAAPADAAPAEPAAPASMPRRLSARGSTSSDGTSGNVAAAAGGLAALFSAPLPPSATGPSGAPVPPSMAFAPPSTGGLVAGGDGPLAGLYAGGAGSGTGLMGLGNSGAVSGLAGLSAPSSAPMQRGFSGFQLAADLDLLDDDFLDEAWTPSALEKLSMVPPGAGPSAGAGAGGPMVAVPQQAGGGGGPMVAPVTPAVAGPAGQFLSLDPGSVMDLDDMSVLDELAGDFEGSSVNLAHASALAGATPAPMLMSGGVGVGAPTMIHIPGLPPVPATVPPGGGLPQVLPPPLFPPMSHAFRYLPQPGAFPGAPAPRLAPPPPPDTLMGVGQQASTGSASDQSSMGVLDEALNLLTYDSSQVSYIPEETLMRFSAKLFNCTPAQLPPDLKASLVNMLSCNAIEGYIRPGCVHLTVDALMGPEERQALATEGVRAVVERLVAAQPHPFWRQHTVLLQLGDKICLVREGKVVHVLATGSSTRIFPRLAHARPLVATPSPISGDVDCALWGFNLGQEGDELLARSGGAYLQTQMLSLDCDPAWGGLQRLVVRVHGASPGPLTLEITRGGFVSATKTLCVTTDIALKQELKCIETEANGTTDVDTLMRQLGELTALPADAEARGAAGRAARRLLPFVLQRKWAAATALVLSRLSVDLPAAEAMAQADVIAAGSTGMPVLQLAVRTQRHDLVSALLQWAARHGHHLNATTPGRRNLTALHLAALVPDGGAIARLLTDNCPDALGGWSTAHCEDGQTPLSFAEKRGSLAAIVRAIAAKQYELMSAHGQAGAAKEELAKVEAEAAAANNPGTPTNGKLAAATRGDGDGPCLLAEAVATEECCSSGTCAAGKAARCAAAAGHKATAVIEAPTSKAEASAAAKVAFCEESEAEGHSDDDLAREKKAARAAAAAMSPRPQQSCLLSFRSPEIEQRYAAWFNAGQVPVDLAFMVIALLSQAAWVLRWSGDCSLMASAMLALLVVNASMMSAAVMRPSAYARRRQGLALASHLAHKAAQLLVTVTPPAGAVFAPTFNPTVAVLESSGLAQVAMLSFGLKLRFTVHLAAAAVHLLAAWAATPSICRVAFPGAGLASCTACMGIYQALAVAALPCTLVYLSERRSRRVFLETTAASDAVAAER